MDNVGVTIEVPNLSSHNFRESEENNSFLLDPETYGLPKTLSHLGIDWNLIDISEFETFEPLGILVELAKGGKIDPWDIDIVQLTDSFLGKVEELKKMDLRISSRTLLYSAILLRMKSSRILEVEEEEIKELDSDFVAELNLPESEDFHLPKFPIRRTSTRPVTLNELMLELKKVEKTISKKKETKTLRASEQLHLHEDIHLNTGDVLGIAHEEAISSRLVLIWASLAELFMIQPVILLSRFLEISEDRIMDYLSLLFLASNRKIWLFQNELFGELYIYPGEESGFSTENNPSSFNEIKLESKSEFLRYQIQNSFKANSISDVFLDE